MNIEVFHGTVEQAIIPVAWQGENLYSVYKPIAPGGFLSDDIRSSIIFADRMGIGQEIVSTWNIPEEYLKVVERNKEGSRWFISNLIADPLDIPMPVLQLRGFTSYEQATVAVARGEIQFCYVPHEYYQSYETVDAILARLKSKTE